MVDKLKTIIGAPSIADQLKADAEAAQARLRAYETAKPHRGRITDWTRVWIDDERYHIFGFSQDHPRLAGHLLTSVVLKHDEATGEIETKNQRFRLVGPEVL